MLDFWMWVDGDTTHTHNTDVLSCLIRLPLRLSLVLFGTVWYWENTWITKLHVY